jgi:bifunctional non-homologous end joining protein LigD
MGLNRYESKRRFDETPEPKPGSGKGGDSLVFVVHKHAAKALHYDLRLEMDGVLKSWAVPKGPSLDPSHKRLAVMVEDHPLEYKDFEGVIPEHNYGGGGIIIWDKGSYFHISEKDRTESERLLLEGLEKGDVKFVLVGEKLRGEFALIKTKKDEKSWLLLKKKDQYATTSEILKENRSAVSGKTLEDLAQAEPKDTSLQKKVHRISLQEVTEEPDVMTAPVTPMPHSIKPMLTTLIKEPFNHPDWLFEVKWDGYRAVAEIRDGEVMLFSRNLISLNQRFPPVVEALGQFDFEAVLDGEIVVVDGQGQSDFQMLQDYPKSAGGHLIYYVFDLLHFQGHDLTNLPLVRRKELLKKILPASPRVKFSDHVQEEGILFFKVAKEKGLEGIMAKEALSHYQIGRRSRQWLKIKTHMTQEAIVAGFTTPRGGRRHFGALVLGVFEENNLVFIGDVGGGFSARTLKGVKERLDPLICDESPFTTIPKLDRPVTWVKPEIVCEVVFHGWTKEGIMRQPVFSRLSDDKQARDVVREKAEERD